MTQRMNGGRGHAVAGAFVFLLLGLFAVLSTMLVLLGAQAYRSLTAAAERHNTERILHAYVYNAALADDAAGALEIGQEGGLDVLRVVYDYGDGDVYVKRIYCCDGALRELFAAEEYVFEPEEGEAICPAESMKAEIDRGLLSVTLTGADGRTVLAQAALRAAGG